MFVRYESSGDEGRWLRSCKHLDGAHLDPHNESIVRYNTVTTTSCIATCTCGRRPVVATTTRSFLARIEICFSQYPDVRKMRTLFRGAKLNRTEEISLPHPRYSEITVDIVARKHFNSWRYGLYRVRPVGLIRSSDLEHRVKTCRIILNLLGNK